MSEDAEVLARIRRRWADEQAAYRARHPGKADELARRRRIATAIFRERFRAEYDAAVAQARVGEPGPARQVHYRTALAALRASHPDEWREALTQAKETK